MYHWLSEVKHATINSTEIMICVAEVILTWMYINWCFKSTEIITIAVKLIHGSGQGTKAMFGHYSCITLGLFWDINRTSSLCSTLHLTWLGFKHAPENTYQKIHLTLSFDNFFNTYVTVWMTVLKNSTSHIINIT